MGPMLLLDPMTKRSESGMLRLAEPLMGYNGWVSSVTYSPDGSHIISGSGDHSLIRTDVCL